MDEPGPETPATAADLPPLDLCIVCLHPAGGVKSSLYQLWRGLRRRGVDAGLVTGLSGFGIDEHPAVIDLDRLATETMSDVVDVLAGVEFDSLYVYNVYSLPYVLPFVDDAETLFHVECWREELVTLLSLVQERDPGAAGVDADSTAYDELRRHDGDTATLPSLDDDAFLECYAAALDATDFVASLVAEDAPLVEQLVYSTGWDGSGVEHLPPLVDTATFEPRSNPPADAKRVLVNGRKTDAENAERNVTVASDLARRNPGEWEVLIAGTGAPSGPTTEAVPDATRDLDAVRRLPRVPFDDVPSLYAETNLYALLSERGEGFSVSTMEAMACGCVPVITPFVARRMADLPRPGENCVIAGGDRGFEACVRRLTDDPDELARLRDNAIGTIQRRYSMDRLDDYRFFRRLE